MYFLQLTESLISAQQDDIVREVTVGDLLCEVAVERASATALLEVDMDAQTVRRRTYSELPSATNPLVLALARRYTQGQPIPGWVTHTSACRLRV